MKDHLPSSAYQMSIVGRFSDLTYTDAGLQACIEYVSMIEKGHDEQQARHAACAVLERHGHQVNQHGGADFRMVWV